MNEPPPQKKIVFQPKLTLLHNLLLYKIVAAKFYWLPQKIQRINDDTVVSDNKTLFTW